METIKNEKIEEATLDDGAFEIICQHKDTYSSNLNQVFDSYGCNTLEAKVPVINDITVEKLRQVDDEQKMYAHLALKSKSASEAMEGRAPRTRNRVLKVVEIDNEVVISAGPAREESPVDEKVLDDEIEQYMKERALLKANNPVCDDVVDGVEDMDKDLDEYMKEATRKRTQKKLLVEQTERLHAMDDMEAEFDLYSQDAGDKIQF